MCPGTTQAANPSQVSQAMDWRQRAELIRSRQKGERAVREIKPDDISQVFRLVLQKVSAKETEPLVDLRETFCRVEADGFVQYQHSENPLSVNKKKILDEDWPLKMGEIHPILCTGPSYTKGQGYTDMRNKRIVAIYKVSDKSKPGRCLV